MSAALQTSPADTASPAVTGELPTEQDLRQYFQSHYADLSQHGWRSAMKWRFGYFSPEAWYEALVDRLVTPRTVWIDVGGGKAVFPHTPALSRTLADRCVKLVGVDPSDNIQQNEFVHERAQCLIEDYQATEQFDLATLRMVVEHIQTPAESAAKLAELVRPGGFVVIYTPNRWSLASVVASVTPQWFHNLAAGFLWRAKEEDVFPTVYKMNTRQRLASLMSAAGFRETGFARLASCSIWQRFRVLYFLELCLWRVLRAVGLPYPETNLLGVYQRLPA
jgi:SAM-dependent methyltransferase